MMKKRLCQLKPKKRIKEIKKGDLIDRESA